MFMGDCIDASSRRLALHGVPYSVITLLSQQKLTKLNPSYLVFGSTCSLGMIKLMDLYHCHVTIAP